MRIAFAKDRSTANAAASQQAAVAVWPVLSPRVAGSDRRSPTEFTDPGDERFVEQTSLVKIVKQCRQRSVRWRDQIILESVEIVAVSVPEVLTVVVPVD